MKRSVQERILFKFDLKIPEFDWKKEIGSRDVGSSFGLHFENSIGALFSAFTFPFFFLCQIISSSYVCFEKGRGWGEGKGGSEGEREREN